MQNITVRYPPLSAVFCEGDLEVLHTFESIIAQNCVALFSSTENPEWVLETDDHTSPLCCLRVGQRDVLCRTVAELRTITSDRFLDALFWALRDEAAQRP
jgi:hypothetical protein